MNINQKKRRLMNLIEKMDEARLDALLTLLEKPKDDLLLVSEDDWAQIRYRNKQVEEGNIEDLDAWKSLKNLRDSLKKKKK